MSKRKPTVRICADCQHCTVKRALLVLRTEYCQHPRAVDVVTGRPVWQARQMRDPGSRLCGPGGRLWAARTGSLADQSSMRVPALLEAAAEPLADTPADPVDVVAALLPLAPRRRRA